MSPTSELEKWYRYNNYKLLASILLAIFLLILVITTGPNR